jgi:hypothetical protein
MWGFMRPSENLLDESDLCNTNVALSKIKVKTPSFEAFSIPKNSGFELSIFSMETLRRAIS